MEKWIMLNYLMLFVKKTIIDDILFLHHYIVMFLVKYL